MSEAENPNTGHTFRDIVEPGWTNLVYASAALIMIFQILGAGSMLANSEMATDDRERTSTYFRRLRARKMYR